MMKKRRILRLPVKREYFEQIKAGTKKEEYRVVCDHWNKRIKDRKYDQVMITLGYPPLDDPDRVLVFPWKGYTRRQIVHSHWDYAPVEVFAIKLEVT